MKVLLLFLVAAMAASQALGEDAKPSGAGVSVTTVRRGGANLGLLTSQNFKCFKPDPKLATFGWAHSGVNLPSDGAKANSPGGPTGNRCYDVCGLGYRLASIYSPPDGPPKEPLNDPSGPPRTPPDFPAGNTTYLCRIKRTSSNGTAETLYGYYTGDSDKCSAYSPVDGKVVQQSVGDGFDCGCCGTINRDGQRWQRGCSMVTASVAKGARCPAGLSQAPKGGEPGTEICSKAPPGGGPQAQELWGTINPQDFATGRCFVAPLGSADGDTAALPNPNSYNRFCYKINPYSGPPTKDCKNNNP